MFRVVLVVIALGAPLGTASAAPPAPAAAPAPASGAAQPALQVVAAPDGGVELRDARGTVARVAVKTPALRRGNPTARELEVDGHRVLELRVPVRGTAGQEVWVAERAAGGAPRVIWTGMTGPRDADEEAATWLEVTAERVLEYQTAAQVTRCDGATARLFPRAYDFDGGKFRPVMSPAPEPAAQKLVARRGDPAMPAGQPIGGFHWVAASTTAAAGTDARALAAPTALDDGNPATVWAEGLGGDGRGEFLTARSSGGTYAVRGLRIFPGDGSSESAFRAGNRPRRFQLVLGPGPEQRFDVELPEDPAADAARWKQPYWVALPKPVTTSCVSVVLSEVARGGAASPPKSFGTTAIGDIAVFTELDGPEGAERLVADLARSADCPSRVQMVVALGAPAVLPTAQAVLATRGPSRECLLEALVALEPAPKNPIVADALVAAVAGATEKEERLIVAALQRAAAPPVGALEQQLNAPKASIDDRGRAAHVLGALADERAPAALLGALGHGPEPLRAAVVQALSVSPAVRPEPVLAALERAPAEGPLRHGDLLRVLPAAVKRGPEKRPEALAAVNAALGADRPFEVRGRAVMALGALGGNDGGAALAALRNGSDDPVLRYLATRELGAVGGADAAAALRAALADRDPRVRETAAQGIGRLKDRAAGQSLIDGAKQEPWPFVRRAELEALGHLCVPGTAELMIRATERDVDEVRRAALVTLARCKDPRGKAVLLRTLGRRNEAATLREMSAALLGELGDRSAAPEMAAALERLVNESEADIALEGVAAATLRALAHLGGPQAVAAAVKLAADKRHPFRGNAVDALGLLCDPGAGAAALKAIVAGGEAGLAMAAHAAERHCASKAAP